MTDKDPGPNAHRYKQATDSRSDNTDNHNSVLLGRRVGIDNHFGGLRGRIRKCTSKRRNPTFRSGLDIYDWDGTTLK